jgi:hypothetical protein
MAVLSCNPNAQVAEAGKPQVWGQPGLCTETHLYAIIHRYLYTYACIYANKMLLDT